MPLKIASHQDRIQQAEDALKLEKSQARRAELADAALETMGQLGFAKSSLREIAQNTQFSHGVFHYYFKDKLDLILCGVRRYKAVCVTRYDAAIADATTQQQLLDGFLGRLAETMRLDASMHRLWYDLRSQALFDAPFRKDVQEIDRSQEEMIWRVVSCYAALANVTPRLQASALYALFDGLFQKHLLRHLAGDETAVQDLLDEVRALMPMIA